MVSRRQMIQGVGAAALAQNIEIAHAQPSRKWPIEEGADTPKLCLAMGDAGMQFPAGALQQQASVPAGRGGGYGGTLAPRPDAATNAYQRLRQIGVTHLLGVNVGLLLNAAHDLIDLGPRLLHHREMALSNDHRRL